MFTLLRDAPQRIAIDEPTRLRRLEIERSLAELHQLGLVSSPDETLMDAVAAAARPDAAGVHVMAVRSPAVTRYFVALRHRVARAG